MKIRKSLRKINQYKSKITLIIAVVMVVVLSGVLLGRTGVLNKLFTHKAFLETGYSTEVKTVTGTGPGFAEGNAGSFSVTKSAEWTDRLEATINLTFDTKEIKRNTNRDIILVLDVSESMDQERIDTLKDAVANANNNFFDNSNNRMALITFSSSSEIKNGFTNNKTAIQNSMDNLVSTGATNYYLALKQVENLLSTYTRRTNTDLHMIFITDGYVTEGVGLYETQYKKLKNKYPYLMSTGIQFEMGDDIALDVKKISDYQYYSFMKNTYGNKDLKSVLYDAFRGADYYSSIKVTDYIDEEYFTIDPNQSIELPFGNVEIVNNGSSQQLIWDIPANKIKSGSNVKYYIEYKIKLKEEYSDTQAYFPVGKSISLNAKSPNISDYSMTMTDTPVLKSWYEVTYNVNVPEGCNTSYSRVDEVFPYDTVRVDSAKLYCTNYQFKGWEVNDEDAVIVNDEVFIMPSHDIQIGAKWTGLSIDKSMMGVVNKRSTLYQTIAAKATLDNIKSEFVQHPYSGGIYFREASSDTNGKGVYTDNRTSSDTYPIHFYRGNINDNNVIFGDYCWKIIRTTSTGGIKLLYNGVPSGGQCNASGTLSAISETSMFNDNNATTYDKSFAYTGYMYGDEYEYKTQSLGRDEWARVYGVANYVAEPDYYGGSYLFADSYTFFEGTGGKMYYKLVNPSWSPVNSSVVGKYTIFSDSSNTGNTLIRYIENVDTSAGTITYVGFDYDDYLNSGSSSDIYNYYWNRAQNDVWYYGNDVTYNSSTGLYTLQNTIALKPIEYGDNISNIQGEGDANSSASNVPVINDGIRRHYTCKFEGTSCKDVYYFYADREEFLQGYYITLSNGKNIDDALEEMVTNTSNTKSSTLKNTIDNWFEDNMNTDRYLNMLEDTPYCNDRRIKRYAAWDKDGLSTENLYFNEFDSEFSYSCNVNDSFTVNSLNGNGKLTYPVGTITASELIYAGADYNVSNSNFYANSGVSYWTMSSAFHNNLLPKNFYIDSNGKFYYDYLYQSYYVRPVVSLKPGVYVADGDGTQLNPYVIEMG